MNKPTIITINAISGGGKTTVTRALQARTPNSAALYFDDRDYESMSGIDNIPQWVEDGADCDRFDLHLLAEDIDVLINKGVSTIFMDYPFGRRNGLIAPFVDHTVFIDTPLDIAMARRIFRDFASSTAKEISDDLEYYLKHGRAAYLYGQEAGYKEADIIVDGSLTMDEIVEEIERNISAIC